ncbi:PP2C family serine/threonine-protein phosphatase [Cellulophaga sp. E16_2]|uniref:PP2C family serine/threonine-protein phosphatase n=1 Tax=Cellulophaga sp. E16_2 TaxID=2789297 RepID=UPI0021080448|nr:PP2C family serine/threonine-protein phosphatase [Cellulophaga sp. E16_2]
MSDVTNFYLEKLLSSKGKNWDEKSIAKFTKEESIIDAISQILKLQKNIMEKWEIRTKIIDFENKAIIFPNATQNTTYLFSFNSNFFENNEIQDYLIDGLEELGLYYNEETLTVEGVPKNNGNFKIDLKFKVIGESDIDELHLKQINLVVNPDPKLLWKDIPSNKDALYWKEENKSSVGILGERKIVVSSKRGRSHKNVGSFRDDDYAFKNFEESGWGVVVVSDGAGSAPLSRKGSELACNEVITYFEEVILPNDELKSIENAISIFSETKDEILLEEAKNDVKKTLYKASLHVHTCINKFAAKTLEEHPEVFEQKKTNYNAEFFHSTLIFTAFKKTEIGFLILTFGVGDCPIGIVNKDKTEAKLLNWLDVGEFGGGTRFITQPEIFHSKERPMATRFNIHIQEDFSFLFLMTDGIYDPKFEVEANLEKTEKWLNFINDLEGDNEDDVFLDFNSDPEVLEKNLNLWMDFWSKGNHDDRTLAIIY